MTDIVPETEPMKVVESLSLLLSDELDRVPELMYSLVVDEKSIWIYLAVAWVYEHPADFDDNPLQVVEVLYADFDYPSEMEPFVPFMPPPAGATPGIAGLEQRLREYLTDSWERYFVTRERYGENQPQ
jgi:hypothetical protein